jgi:glycosyltransferase involved in cell wall biosynthesis
MIVRDEALVIDRCLSSVAPFIDYWVIVDTGSTDNTPVLVEKTLAGIPGELHHRPWKNFGHNRTEALELGPVNTYGAHRRSGRNG